MTIVVAAASLLFFAQHSLLASRTCKVWARRRLGLDERAYRRAYVIVAIISTVIWLGSVHALPDQPLYRIEGPAAWALRLVQLTGLALMLLSLRPIDVIAFLGLRLGPIDGFVEAGIYHRLRHPMYSGAILVLLAFPEQSVNGMTMAVLTSLYLVTGARFEERRLALACPGYEDYRRRVPAFVPRICPGRARL